VGPSVHTGTYHPYQIYDLLHEIAASSRLEVTHRVLGLLMSQACAFLLQVAEQHPTKLIHAAV
jgi:hypothetical protein